MRFLTPTLGLNSFAIATRSQSTCHTDALPAASPTCDFGGLHHQFEHGLAVSGQDLTTPQAASIEAVIVVAVRSEACCNLTLAESPQVTRAGTR